MEQHVFGKRNSAIVVPSGHFFIYNSGNSRSRPRMKGCDERRCHSHRGGGKIKVRVDFFLFWSFVIIEVNGGVFAYGSWEMLCVRECLSCFTVPIVMFLSQRWRCR